MIIFYRGLILASTVFILSSCSRPEEIYIYNECNCIISLYVQSYDNLSGKFENISPKKEVKYHINQFNFVGSPHIIEFRVLCAHKGHKYFFSSNQIHSLNEKYYERHWFRKSGYFVRLNKNGLFMKNSYGEWIELNKESFDVK